jgi:hypothetical protein
VSAVPSPAFGDSFPPATTPNDHHHSPNGTSVK